MFQELRPAVVALIVLTLITGVLYPLAVTGVAQVVFPDQANGSLIRSGEQIIGSRLIGQSFDDPRYFWGRLSATSPPYNAAASSGSNYGPLNPALKNAVQARLAALTAVDGDAATTNAKVPVDLATASGSGLDPHISPAAARHQIARVARVRGLRERVVTELVEAHVEGRTFGFLGEPRVNVLALNLALDSLH